MRGGSRPLSWGGDSPKRLHVPRSGSHSRSCVEPFFGVLGASCVLICLVQLPGEDSGAASACQLPEPSQSCGYSPELCKRSRPVPQIMNFVFPAFTLNPFFSTASFHIKSLLTHSSRESAMMTRSSAIGPPRDNQPKTHVTRPPEQ